LLGALEEVRDNYKRGYTYLIKQVESLGHLDHLARKEAYYMELVRLYQKALQNKDSWVDRLPRDDDESPIYPQEGHPGFIYSPEAGEDFLDDFREELNLLRKVFVRFKQ